MKTQKRFLMVLLSAVLSGEICAQWYGQIEYQHDSTTLTSAKRIFNAATNGGYIMGGYRPVRQAGSASPDFVIDRVDNMGTFSSGGCFSADYQFMDDAVCGGTNPVFKNNCGGIMVIETQTHQEGMYYAMVGIYDEGVFFATLDGNGNVLSQRSWNYGFQIGTWYKPCIRESSKHPGEFYICASPNYFSYVMKVDAFGNQLWGKEITTNFSPTEVRDIIESPYGTASNPEVIVVGRTDVNWPMLYAADAFFLRLDANNGNYIGGSTYNFFEGNYDSDDWFSCIEVAKSNNGGNGFILGGRTLEQDGNNPGTGYSNLACMQWMCKLSPTGGVIWSTIIKPFAHINGTISGDEINHVFERFNQNSGSFEYYGVGGSNYAPPYSSTGMMRNVKNLVVFKLDDLGTVGSLSPTEFHYLGGEATQRLIFTDSDLTGIETGGGADDGIQAFGTTYGHAGHYFVKGYFNGFSGCKDTIVDIDSIASGPQFSAQFNPNMRDIGQCNRIQIIKNPLQGSYLAYCYANSLPSGSNARPVGIEGRAFENSTFNVYPNPVLNKTTVVIPSNVNGIATLSIYDALGREVRSFTVDSDRNHELEVDFSRLHIKNGFYTLSLKSGSEESTCKLIYNGE